MNTTPLYLLIAEDEAAHVEAVRRAFEKSGTTVEIRDVKTLREYRASVAERTPDLALVDLNLPDGQALDVLTHPPEDAAFPVLVMTAFGSQEIVVNVMKAGALDYVVKSPEAFARMPRIVERGIREWKLLQRHKKAEAALQQSESKYSRLAEGAPDIIYRFSNQRGGLYYSAHVEVVLGYSVQHLLEHPFLWQTSIEPTDLEHVRLAVQKLATDESFDIEYRIKDAVGKWHWLRDRSIGQSQEGDEILFEGIATDITERKQTETYREMGREALQILNEPGTLPNALQRVIAVLKTRTGFDAVGLRLQDGDDFPYYAQEGLSKDFLLTENTLLERDAGGGVCQDKDGNASLECTCGLVISGKTDAASPLFTKGGSFWTNDSFPLLELPPDKDFRHHPRNQCIHQGYASVALVPIRSKDRIVGLIHLNDRRKGCFSLQAIELLEGIAMHIDAALMRKRAEETLLASEQEFRAMFEVAAIGMAQADPYTQHWLRVNAKMCAITGYSADEMLKMRITELTHPADRQQDLELFQRVVRGELPDYRMEKRYLRKDGTVAWVNVNMTVIRDAASQPVRTMVTVEDITERKRQELELQKIDKLQSVGTLAGGIAHDFNNILQGLYGNVSLAMEDLAKAHPSYALLEDAGKSMNRAIRLTKQLLTFAKGGDPVKESVSLEAMAEEIVRFDLTGSNVILDINHDEDLWPVDADRGQIQQVISNLVINARQAMPKGGHLHITLENANIPAEAVPGLSAGRYVKVIVRDEGIGIDQTVLDHIFDPYFTTKQTGHGLGLATVWSIISRHTGHIGVVSELGNGTTFTFYLPASESAQPADSVPPPAGEITPRAPARAAKILVMDDEESVCRLTARMLKSGGYSVTTALDSQRTIALYRQALESGEPFDLVITDMTIPGGLGGKETVKALLALDPHVRAIVSSGYAEDPVMSNPVAYGFKDAAAKPYTPSELREVVARVLKCPRARTPNEAPDDH